MRDPKLFVSDMLIKHHKLIHKLKGKKKYDGQNKFTVVSAVYGVEKYLDDYFESLVKQNLDFKNHIHLVMVDDGSKDNSAAIIKKWQEKYPDNITYILKENGGQASARNLGMQYVKTQWVTFIDPDDFVDKNYFLEINYYLESYENKIGMVSCNFYVYFEEGKIYKNNHPLNFKFKGKSKLLSRESIGRNIQMSVNSTIFLTDIIVENNIKYNESIRPNFEDSHFVGKYLYYINNLYISYLVEAKYFYRKRSDESSTLDTSWKDKRVFLDKIKYGHHTILDFYVKKMGYVPDYIQTMILYDISWVIKKIVKDSDAVFKDLTEIEISEFYDLLRKSLAYISHKTILTFNIANFWWLDKVILLGAFKNAPMPWQYAYIEKITARGELVFSVISHFNQQIEIKTDGKLIVPTLSKDISYDAGGVFLAKRSYYWIQLSDLGEKIGIYSDGKILQLTTRLKRYTTEVSTKELLEAYVKPNQYKKQRKDILVFMDRNTQADDNAEHLYRYFSESGNDDFAMYFAITKDSKDWKRLKNLGFNLLDYGCKDFERTLKKSKFVISSHADAYISDYFKDFNMQKPLIFLQHGVIQNNLSTWLNTKNNLELFITSTESEYNSIAGVNSPYLLSNKEVKLTGLARYDSLWKKNTKMEKEKIILVMPTWRQYIVTNTLGKSIECKNKIFRESSYYKYWNSFFCNKELERIVRSEGYRVIFVPHPNMLQYIDEFELPSYIENTSSLQSFSIQDLFVKSRVLITDYSSVAFDMAYINRSILYYHFDKEEFYSGAHTSSLGYFSYEEDGFGPVVNTEDALLQELKNICINNGDPSDEYLTRIRKTFTYQDDNNCERIYNEILTLNKIID